MSSGYMKVIALGYVGADSELRATASGQAVLNFRIACTETWKDKDGSKQEKTEWLGCVVWGPRAEALAKFVLKGQQILVEGKLRTREWDKDGVKHYRTEVHADEIVLCGGRGDRGASGAPADARAPRDAAPQQSRTSAPTGRAAAADGYGSSSKGQRASTATSPVADDFGGGPIDDDIPFASCDPVHDPMMRWHRYR